ncbi:hypothetical protein NSP_25310 [Nodularia spumigena CCY9414]|nr:hypothetical protein NSP_25310 [Nodularia spumigena CCY9414]
MNPINRVSSTINAIATRSNGWIDVLDVAIFQLSVISDQFSVVRE